jgi:phosphate transport system substrate-binding protein
VKHIVALSLSCFLAAPVAAETLVFAGSTTVLPIMEAMTPVFEEHGIEPEIQAGGSTAGYKAAKMGMADIGMMSRELKDAEAEDVDSQAIARDWLVFVANEDAPFDNITTEQVVDLYTGKTDELDGYKINAVDKEAGRGTKTRFDRYFDLAGETASDLVVIGPNGQAVTTVAGDPHGLAYLSWGFTQAAIEQGEPLKILDLDGVAPTPENVKSGEYGLARNLNLVYTDKNAEAMERVREVLATPEAEAIFLEMGYSPAL